MTTASQMNNRYALITGGSTGIGAAIAQELARHGANLVLVARDAKQLERTAGALRERHGATVLTVPLNLAEPQAPRRLLRSVREAGIEVEMLVNSAGMSVRSTVAAGDPARQRRLVDLNVGALTELTALLVAQMVGHGHGSIINIASTGAYAPAPYLAAYAASKAYVLSFTAALWAETRDSDVKVVAVSPGPTQTPMNAGSGSAKREPAQVARTALSALEASGPVVVDGGRNKVTAAVIRHLPASVMALLAARIMARRG